MELLNMFVVTLSFFAFAGCASEDFVKPQTSDGTRGALVLGVENGYAGKCYGSLKDAETMTKVFSKLGITNLTVLTDEKATRSAAKTAISEVLKNDVAFVYYSGHGGQSSSGDESEADGKDEYLCLYDAPLLDNEIWNAISASTGRVILVFDCCHSETMFRLSPPPKFAAGRSGSVPNVLCWSACADDTYSYGSTFGGFFTNAIEQHYWNGLMKTAYSYETLWSRLESDKSLKRNEIIKKTVIGQNFEDFAFGY